MFLLFRDIPGMQEGLSPLLSASSDSNLVVPKQQGCSLMKVYFARILCLSSDEISHPSLSLDSNHLLRAGHLENWKEEHERSDTIPIYKSI